jgi:hypothetical protein
MEFFQPSIHKLYVVSLLTVLMLVSACADSTQNQAGPAPADTMRVETRADSVAMHAYDALGGPNAWASVPYLRFDFASGSDTSRTLRASHLWNRMTGDYRVEMHAGGDSTYVALFNVNTREGDVYLNGEEVEDATEQELLEQAYGRFINDTYWLLMPVKMMDSGVTRTYLPDSSTSEMDVLRLSFDGVGLTPGDQYWVYVDKNSGLVEKWAFRLQRHPPDHVPQPIQWVAYKTFDTPTGPIQISERKIRNGSITYTDNVDVPEDVPEGAFTDPNPMLQGS